MRVKKTMLSNTYLTFQEVCPVSKIFGSDSSPAHRKFAETVILGGNRFFGHLAQLSAEHLQNDGCNVPGIVDSSVIGSRTWSLLGVHRGNFIRALRQ
jgi:hypothetical protein